MKTVYAFALVALLSGCAAKVRQLDLDAWVGAPVEALDTHSVFLTIPMVRTITPSGIEIRNYANGADFSSCSSIGSASGGSGYVSSKAFTSCSNNRIVCNNIFYIKDGKVIEYAPTGQCYTDGTVRPQPRWSRLRGS